MKPFFSFPVLVSLVALVLGGAVACTPPCMQVQQVLCTCEATTQDERTACEDRASDQESLAPVTAEQNELCEQILPDCEAFITQADGCERLATLEGRQACGLSPR